MDPWEEPVRGGYPHESFGSLDGIARQERFLEFGPRPPIARLTGSRPTEWSPGEASGVLPATGWLVSPQGRVPLGALALVADLAFGMSFATTLQAGAGFTTAELSLYRLGSPALGGLITAHGRLVHAGNGVALTECRVYDAEGHLVAAGMSRLALFPPPPELMPIPDPLPPVDDADGDGDSPDPWEREPLGAVLGAEVWRTMSGRQVLEAQIAGDLPLPPLARLTGMRVTEVGEGEVTVVLPASGWLTTPARTVQGGFTAMLADAALQCAMQSTVETGDQFVPLDIKVNYMRPVLPDGRFVTAKGSVTHRGRSLAIAHAELTDADGRRVAVATGSALISPIG